MYSPPYHPELNQIELCLARMKNHIADNPCYKTKKLLEHLIPQAATLITPFYCQKAYNYTLEETKSYSKTDQVNESDNSFDSYELSDNLDSE